MYVDRSIVCLFLNFNGYLFNQMLKLQTRNIFQFKNLVVLLYFFSLFSPFLYVYVLQCVWLGRCHIIFMLLIFHFNIIDGGEVTVAGGSAITCDI